MSDIGFTRKMGDGAVARPQAAGATASATATVANLPAGLSNVAVGALVKALVMSQNGRGVTLLQTDNGTLTLQTNLPLRPGNELVLQVQSVGAQTRVVILSIDNQSLAGAKGTEPQRTLPQATPGPGRQESSGASRAPSGSTPATPAGRAYASGVPQSAGQDALSPAAVKPALRHDMASEVRGPVTPGLVIAARVTAGGGPAVILPSPAQAKPLATGETITVRVLATGAEPAPLLPAPSGSAPLRGTIIPSAPAGTGPAPSAGAPITLIAVGDARIALAAPPPGPPGSDVVFQILETRAPTHGAAQEALHREFLRFGTDWRSLKDTINLLRDANVRDATGEALSVPRPGPHMASAMLFFMAALKGGDVLAWLGEARAERLANAPPGQLLGQLSDDFATMARHAGDAAATGWHAFAIPVDTGARAEIFRLYYRRHGGKGGERGGQEATHFVVEAELSRIGLFQLEGLVRPRQFDLVVHSATQLNEPIQEDIRQIFLEALSVGDLGGTIRFDGTASAPFSPAGTARQAAGHDTAVIA